MTVFTEITMDVSKISKLDSRQLRAELKEVNLSQAGKKADLQQRLLDHFNIDSEKTAGARKSQKMYFTTF